jgi:tellurite resistance protein
MNTPHWLSRFPAALFAIPVGLFALGGAWRRSAAFGWALARPVADLLAGLGLAVLTGLLLVYVAKLLRHRQAVLAEYRHPVAGSLLALLPLALLLCIITFGVPAHEGWLALALATLLLMAVIAIRVVAVISTGALPAAMVTPALYVPPVGGGLVGGMALQVLGYPGWAALLFGMGLVSWALLEMRVLNRLFEGPMPEPLRPTIGLELAAPTVGTLTVATLWPQLPGELLIIGLGIAAGPIVAVAARYKWWGHVPFAPGFWSFSFPAAAFAASTVEIVRRGGWPQAVAALALGLATLLIGFLLLRTVLLLAQGRLIPPAAMPAPAARP